MTADGGSGTTIIRKAGDIGDFGAIKLLPLCNLYMGPCSKSEEIRRFFEKLI